MPEKYIQYISNPRKRKLHITTSIAPHANPVDSNELDFKPIDQPFTIVGRFGFFSNDRIIHYAK